VDLTEHFA
jgi:hypothetical protein